MNSAIWMSLYLCAIFSLAWCADANPDKVDETPSKGDADPTEGKVMRAVLRHSHLIFVMLKPIEFGVYLW